MRLKDWDFILFLILDGFYKFKVMLFGMLNSLVIFKRFMCKVLKDLKYIVCFLDDILIYIDFFEEYLLELIRVLGRLR